MIKPFYQDKWATIYLGNCLEIMPELEPVDLVLTDPPYPDFNSDHGKDWIQTSINFLREIQCKQFIFWPAKGEFPLDYTAIHIWHKPNGQSNWHYEKIFERNGKQVYRAWSIPIIQYRTLKEWTPHPTQKPLRLITKLLKLTESSLIVDPFMGSGTTLVAAKQLNRKSIGIEIEEKYCEIAARRLSQEVIEWE